MWLFSRTSTPIGQPSTTATATFFLGAKSPFIAGGFKSEVHTSLGGIIAVSLGPVREVFAMRGQYPCSAGKSVFGAARFYFARH